MKATTRIKRIQSHIEMMEKGLAQLGLKENTKAGKTFCQAYILAVDNTPHTDVVYYFAMLRGDVLRELRESVKMLRVRVQSPAK